MVDLGLFGLDFWAEVLAIIGALWVYDYVADPLSDIFWKKLKKSFLERQDIS